MLIRLFTVILKGLYERPQQGFDRQSKIKMRVWPNDVDLNFHLNNAKYLNFIDLGRVDVFIGTGKALTAISKRWGNVVGATQMSYRRSLSPFQSFELESRIIGWDKKWFYTEHIFKSKGQIAAHGLTMTLFKERKKSIPTRIVLDLVDPKLEDERLPPKIFSRGLISTLHSCSKEGLI